MIVELRKYRKKHGETQLALSEVLQVAPCTISMWETGVHLPTLEAVERICRHYDITPGELLVVEGREA